jgi:hypothetical protein
VHLAGFEERVKLISLGELTWLIKTLIGSKKLPYHVDGRRCEEKLM